MATFYAKYPSSGSGGVTSLNGQTGDITLLAGSNITLTPGSGTITISSSGAGSSSQVETHTISAPEAAAKSITLASSPTSPASTILSPAGGGNQFYGDDFVVSGTTLSWSGLGLDGILTTGDRLTIFYM